MSMETMKAIRLHTFGGPEVLRYEDVPKPELQPGEVLVRVHASGFNPPDQYLRDGYNLLPPEWRPQVPLPVIPGSDVSGLVEAVGEGVQDFSMGDEVFGLIRFPSYGGSFAYAEYVSAPASHLAHKPAGIDHVHAAGAPMAGLTAWQFLIELGHDVANPLQPDKHRPVALNGKTVLINGAAGGVGHIALHWQNGKAHASLQSRRASMSRSCAISAPTSSSTTARLLPRTSRTTSTSFLTRWVAPRRVASCARSNPAALSFQCSWASATARKPRSCVSRSR